MALTEPEVEGLRRYLQAGGFLVVDDFWGSPRVGQLRGRDPAGPARAARSSTCPRTIRSSARSTTSASSYQVPNVGNAMAGPHLGEGRLHAVLPRHPGRQGPAHRRHQREHRPRRRLGMGGGAGVSSQVLDVRVPDGGEPHRLLDEPLIPHGPLDRVGLRVPLQVPSLPVREGPVRDGSAVAGGGSCSWWARRPS